MTNHLPAPRLQLRWDVLKDDPVYSWQCHYELVLPLGEHDIRREQGDKPDITELVTPINGPTKRGGSAPCATQPDDAPFRDGAHALWDAKVLGNLPIYVIALDGTAAEFKR